jgi:hypothetical protein
MPILDGTTVYMGGTTKHVEDGSNVIKTREERVSSDDDTERKCGHKEIRVMRCGSRDTEETHAFLVSPAHSLTG